VVTFEFCGGPEDGRRIEIAEICLAPGAAVEYRTEPGRYKGSHLYQAAAWAGQLRLRLFYAGVAAPVAARPVAP